MTSDAVLDGNSMAGPLMELFGREMTHIRARCAQCGSIGPLGAHVVYARSPGDVVRCPACDAVVLVAVERPTGLRFHFVALLWLEPGQ